MKQILKNIAICGLVASAGIFTSCDDFLTIYPTSSIVEEDFWKDKTDLNNAVMGCYTQMISYNMMSRYIYWGEERSDNFERSTESSSTGEMANVMNANLLPTYSQFDWTPAYKEINYCNKVLAHGPEVVANDEAFSENDWKPIRAEIIALRALCHFYLVRTFGEVPYVTQDYNNDSQDFLLGQSTQLQVLDSIITDLESVAGDAMTDYGNTVENKGRITRKAIYAMLADVYLWRASYKQGKNQPFTNVDFASNYTGEKFTKDRIETYKTTAESDYQKCVDYCDKIIQIAKDEKLKKLNESGKNVGGDDLKIELEDLLESNETTSSGSGAIIIVSGDNAYSSLFGDGNSDESILEFQVEGTSNSNSMITSFFYNISDSKVGAITGSTALFEGTLANPNTEGSSVFTKTDYRRWEDIKKETGSGQTDFNIIKYVASSITQTSSTVAQFMTDNTSSNITVDQTLRSSSNVDANWIVYRMSEIYLMKAEAMSQLYSDEDNLKSAFNYVREVFKRSNPYAYQSGNSNAKTDSLNFNSFNTQKTLERLVMAERQREFIGEGKRWYDLVRYALRRGSTAEMLEFLTRKYASNSKAIKAKLASMQSLYSPIYDDDIKNNGLLYQNGVWAVTESSSLTDQQ